MSTSDPAPQSPGVSPIDESTQTEPAVGDARADSPSLAEPTAAAVTAPRAVADPLPVAGPTVEHAAYGLLLVLALFLRLFRLGSATPLSSFEAAQAWAAWLGVGGQGTSQPFHASTGALAHAPLLYTGQRFLLWLTDGGSDAWARFLPALAGALLVLVAWRLRETLGRPVALVLALLLTVDPWLLTFSRTGDGAILSVALGLLLLAEITRPEPLASAGRARLAVIAALFLISGPLAWLLLPVMGGAAFLFARPDLWPVDQREQARFLALFAATALIGATGLLSDWSGLGIISVSLSVALGLLSGDTGQPLGWAFLRLLADHPLLWTLGVAGLVSLWHKPAHVQFDNSRGWRLLLTGWALWGLLLLVLPGRGPVSLLVIGLPLLLAAGMAAARLLTHIRGLTHWQDGSLIAASLSVLLVTTGFWTTYYSNQWNLQGFDPFTLFFYVLLPLLAIFFVWWAGWDTSSRVFALLAAALLFFVSLSSGWSLNLPGQTSEGTSLFVETTRPGMRALAGDVARLSSLRARDPDVAPVTVQVSPGLRPLVGWNLRTMQQLRFVDAIDPVALSDPTALVITENAAAEALAPALPAGYVGSRYPVIRRWSPVELSGTGPTVRWLVLRELKIKPPTLSLVLWAREE